MTSSQAPGRLQRVLESAGFAVTAEIGPPRGADAEPVRRKAALLRDWVDAVNITDNQSASVRLSSWAGSLAALAAGVAPIMQLTCRDRNRIALQSELISAGAMGIPHVLLMTGDHPRHGDHADAKPVFDLNSTELMNVARTLRDEGRLMSGRVVDPAPYWLIGVVENPGGGPADASTARLAAKVAAGAQFVQTQFVFDVPAFAAWMERVRELGLHERCSILAGVGPIVSLRALSHLQDKVPGVHIPGAVAERLRAAGEDGIAAEGERLCAETIGQLREIPGVAGVHAMAVANEHRIPGILRQAGFAPRPEPDRRGAATGPLAEQSRAATGPQTASSGDLTDPAPGLAPADAQGGSSAP
ncbi:MAG: methylenetetrahydrofolate reductase [Streptosporangiaceae bacterium]|jgi:methylenetetrahydrofolate reductase (NADPH)